MRLSITGGRLIDPANGIDAVTDLHLADGRVLAVGAAPDVFQAERRIDARGLLVLPGLVDLAARLGEPGHEHKADIASETQAAVSAGITTLCCPPDTQPPIDSAAVIEFLEQRQEAVGKARIAVVAALTEGLAGQQLSEMASLREAGCVGVGNADRPFASAAVLRHALEYAASLDLTVFLHPEHPELAGDGCVHEGPVATRLGLPAIPAAAETAAIGFYLPLIEQTGVRAHFCHLSTARGMNMVRRARHDGLPVTSDVCAHQLFLTELDVADFNPLCHTRPPLRSQRDRDALRQGLRERGPEVICSDHRPHELDAKLAPFQSTEPGISALETLLPLTLRLVEEGVLDLPAAVAKVTCNPADVLGLPVGRLSVGAPADLCLVDPQREWTCDPQQLLSRGKNSPFGCWTFRGQAVLTVVDGEVVFER